MTTPPSSDIPLSDAGVYRTLLHSIEEGFCVFEMLTDASGAFVDYRFLETSPTFEEQTGLTEAEGKTARELVPDLEDHWVEIYGTVAATGEPARFVNGSEAMGRWFEVEAFRVGAPEQRRVALLFRDVTQRRAAERALQQREARYRQLADAMPHLVWTADPDGIVDYYNARVTDYGGVAQRPDGTWDWEPLVHPDDLEATHAAWQAAQHAAATYECEHRIQMGDGAFRWHLSRATPVLDDHGAVSKWFGTATDIDERKRAEEALRALNEELDERVAQRTMALDEANQRLQASNRELQDFAYVASHDLQEPLRKIQAFAGLLRAECSRLLPDEGHFYVERMEDAARRLSRLISDLLTFSRLTTQGRPFERVDLQALVEAVISDLGVRIEETGGLVHVPEPLPSVEADRTQMRQLVQNLIANGLKFHREDVPPRVEVRAHLEADADGRTLCRLTVQDNGIGFDEKYADRIFTPFQRLHGRAYEGTGMGLAICRKIAERHGGRLSVTSAHGTGSTFTLVLPVEQAGEAEISGDGIEAER